LFVSDSLGICKVMASPNRTPRWEKKRERAKLDGPIMSIVELGVKGIVVLNVFPP